MEERKTIFDYLGEVFMMFGITMMILIILALCFGEKAQTYSTLYTFGNKGLGLATMLQFFVALIIITGLKHLFFTDILIKNMSMAARTVSMLACVLAVIISFAICFDWFPVDMWEPWVMFFLCFGICFGVSVGITVLKERSENRKLEEALERIKKEDD